MCECVSVCVRVFQVLELCRSCFFGKISWFFFWGGGGLFPALERRHLFIHSLKRCVEEVDVEEEEEIESITERNPIAHLGETQSKSTRKLDQIRYETQWPFQIKKRNRVN